MDVHFLCYYRSRGDTNSESILHSELIRENSQYFANLERDVDMKYKMLLLWSDKDMNESASTYVKDHMKYAFLHLNLWESCFWFLLPLECVQHIVSLVFL